MIYDFSPSRLSPGERRLQRFFEILPGATSWSILIGLSALCFAKPLWAAVAIIAFNIYWLMRIFYMTIFLVISYGRLSLEGATDWAQRVRELDGLARGTPAAEWADQTGWQASVSEWVHRRKVRALLRESRMSAPSDRIYQLVLIPVFRERREVIEAGVRSLLAQKTPLGNILVVFALESRADAAVRSDVAGLVHVYRSRFLDVLSVEHPDGVEGEARVKGANVTHAAKKAAEYFRAKGVPFENVIASCFDADTVVTPDYFACLTYHFMICPDRERSSFQPIPVYHNNIWEAPAFARVLEMGSSFFQLIEATNSEKLVTFSSHSMSFRALVDVGYWPVDMISDDSAIFWKAYLHYDGDYRVVPMYVTLSMDVVAAESVWKTARNVYRQKRRWAWGVENFPIVMRGFLKNGRIPLRDKMKHGFKLFESHIAWASWAFMLSVIGWLPALVASRAYAESVFFYSAPRVTSTIFNLASLVFFTTLFLALSLLPREDKKNFWRRRAGFALEWFFMPLVATLLSALPALDAQTRLMFGKYMEFQATDKTRKPPAT